jgi:hypothetical protein
MRTISSIILCALVALPIFQSAPPLGPGRKYTTVERLQLARLRAVHEDRMRLQRARRPVSLRTGYEDYRAILHAHAEDSTHTGGTRPEMLASAKRTGVRIIMLTDHVRPHRDFIDDSWRGIHDGVLFIPGAEAEGFLVYPQRSIKNEKFASREEYISLVKRDGGSIFLSHVEERPEWPTEALDGLEIYNHHSDLKDEGPFLRWLGGALVDPDGLRQLESAIADYPQEFFCVTQDYLAPIIAKWDRDLATHQTTGVAANDCHHNQGYLVKAVAADAIEVSELIDPDKPRRVTVAQSPRVADLLKGRQAGEVIARLDFDPYDRSLTYVTTHILSNELTEPATRAALKAGHAYVSHDWLGDPSGFAFMATKENSTRPVAVMGDEIAFAPGLQLRLEAPLAGQIKLFRNGQVVKQERAEKWQWPVAEAGVYRAEIWLDIDGEQRPWIYTNPIRIK